jgi:hypothetical protein
LVRAVFSLPVTRRLGNLLTRPKALLIMSLRVRALGGTISPPAHAVYLLQSSLCGDSRSRAVTSCRADNRFGWLWRRFREFGSAAAGFQPISFSNLHGSTTTGRRSNACCVDNPGQRVRRIRYHYFPKLAGRHQRGTRRFLQRPAIRCFTGTRIEPWHNRVAGRRGWQRHDYDTRHEWQSGALDSSEHLGFGRCAFSADRVAVDGHDWSERAGECASHSRSRSQFRQQHGLSLRPFCAHWQYGRGHEHQLGVSDRGSASINRQFSIGSGGADWEQHSGAALWKPGSPSSKSPPDSQRHESRSFV